MTVAFIGTEIKALIQTDGQTNRAISTRLLLLSQNMYIWGHRCL